MGIFDRFRGAPKRFVSPDDVEGRLHQQLVMTSRTVERLRICGVTPESILALEFFFYTDTPAKAIALAAALAELRYQVERELSAADEKLQVITGRTTSMQMKYHVVEAWTEQMCKIGFVHDCEFDGWGTSLE